MRPITIISLLICLGCNQKQKAYTSSGDSAIERYFTLVDTSGKFDTADISFKILKAYYYHDTAYLNGLSHYLGEQYNGRNNWDVWQSDIPQPAVDQLSAEEAYRFVFSVYDSPTHEVVTITRTDTVYKLHYLRYYHNADSSSVLKEKPSGKVIGRKDWEQVVYQLYQADYWGLKAENNVRGHDGNDLTVIGYRRFDGKPEYQFVHRWSNTKLNDAFYHIYYKLLTREERLFGSD